MKTTKLERASCAAMARAIEETVQWVRENGDAGRPALRMVIVAALEAHKDALAVAVHNAALAKITVDHWGVAVREADELILELATAAAHLEEVMRAVTEALVKGEAAGLIARPTRRAS